MVSSASPRLGSPHAILEKQKADSTMRGLLIICFWVFYGANVSSSRVRVLLKYAVRGCKVALAPYPSGQEFS